MISQRAGLVMNPDAKVKMRGVQVGKVASIEPLPDGQAALHLAMDPVAAASDSGQRRRRHRLVDGVRREVRRAECRPQTRRRRPLQAGQVLDGEHVTVEINTVFEQLVSVLSQDRSRQAQRDARRDRQGVQRSRRQVRPDAGRPRSAAGQARTRACPTSSHDIEVAPTVLNAYADAAPDLMSTVDNATRISDTIVDEQQNLDALLVSAIGLADVGNDVLGEQPAAADRCRCTCWCRPPTCSTSTTQALNCGLARLVPLATGPPLPDAGCRAAAVVLHLGVERYRYPANLPKVAATGGPQCIDLPEGAASRRDPPFVVTDIGANPCAVRQPGHPAELRRTQAGAVRAARRAAAQHRTDRTTGMTRARGRRSSSSASSRVVMVVLTAFLFVIFGQYRTGSTNELLGGVRRRVRPEGR